MSSKALLFVIFALISLNVDCHELLINFLEFPELNSRVKLNENCREDLIFLKKGIDDREIWALKVRDASGKSTAGFVWGNNFWIGGERACNLLNDPPRINLVKSAKRRMSENVTEIASKVKVEYRILIADHHSKIQFDADIFTKSILHIGLCFPASCDDENVDTMARIIFDREFKNDTLIQNIFYNGTKTLVLRDNFVNDPFVMLLILLSVTFTFLATAGTAYVVRLKEKRRKINELTCVLTNNGVNNNNDAVDVEKKIKKRLKVSVIEKFWKCFSVENNAKFVMSTNIDKKSIPPIHGIRALGMLWIIAGHVYYYAFGPSDNIQLIFAYADAWVLQPLFSAAISVDSFFVMSGFLLSYMFYERQKRRPSKNLTIDVIRGVIYRYLRMAPCFLIIMLLAVTMSIVLNDTSQYTMIEDIEKNCKLYWWRNVFLIQNLFPLEEMCMSWSWYVATDFQLFIISSVIVAISSKNMRLSVIISVMLFAVSAFYSGYVGVKESFSFSLDSQFRSINSLYTKPYSRVGGYLAGVWTGYYLSKVNRQLSMGKAVVNVLRILSAATIIFMVFIQRFRIPGNFWVSFLFPAFGRTAWAVAISFLIVAGSTQYMDGLITKIVNWKLLLPFSRMTFSAYLLNPLIVIFVTMSCETSFHIDFYTVVIFSVGFYAVSYIAAFIFMIFFENPIIMFVKNFAE